MFGIPAVLLPFFFSFMLDAIAVGIVMPLLPFFVMDLGANAMQLSLVVSSNYIAQTIGCIIMGKISDIYGRKLVLLSCLSASSISYFFVSKAQSLYNVALARIISGSLGGLIPIMQSCVADCSSLEERPKYLGRIMATFGIGFVLGPAISALLPNFSTRNKIQLASLLPFSGLIISFLFAKETKEDAKSFFGKYKPSNFNKHHLKSTPPTLPSQSTSSLPTRKNTSMEVLLLTLNGFLLMYAFATESIYAIFMKDSFGYGETVLSSLFALNGLLIGIFQVFLIKPLINMIGKHVTLIVGNLVLAIGMIGFALIRNKSVHFTLFAIHMIGYSIADTALVSLISSYSEKSTQGRDLSFNQAAQSCARVLGPLVAGTLYEWSKQSTSTISSLLPKGALPFLVGALCPAFAALIPSFLLIRKRNRKNKKSEAENNTNGYDDNSAIFSTVLLKDDINSSNSKIEEKLTLNFKNKEKRQKDLKKNLEKQDINNNANSIIGKYEKTIAID
jgi:DHA1 family tetracycline resistance protein-like MFS transporter